VAQFRTTADLLDLALQKAGETTNGNSSYETEALNYMNEVHLALVAGGTIPIGKDATVQIDEVWPWSKKKTPMVIELKKKYDTGTINVTSDSESIVFSDAPAFSVEGWHIKAEGKQEWYRICGHVAGSVNAELDSRYNDDSNAAVDFKVVKLEYDLCPEYLCITKDNNKLDFKESVSGSTPANFFEESYTSSTGFTFDSDEVEFLSGKVQQKQVFPSGGTFYAPFSTSKDGLWGVGSLTGTLNNGATVGSGVLNLTGGAATDKWWSLASTGNAELIQLGTIRMSFRPNYNGSPANDQFIFHSNSTGTTSQNNQLQLVHDSGGNIEITMNDSAGDPIIATTSLGAFVAVSGTDYEFELNYNVNDVSGGNGEVRLFIDGTQQGSTQTPTAATRSIALELRVGRGRTNPNVNAEFSVSNLIIFNIVQHTANYVPGSTDHSQIYVETRVDLPVFTHTLTGNIAALTSGVAIDSNSPRYLIDGRYWNGSVWTTSDGTHAQASSIGTMNANISNFVVMGNTVIISVVFQLSATSGTADLFTLNYTYTAVLLTASIPNGSYTPGDLATAIKTTMEVVGQAIYTVTFDICTKKYTIESDRSGGGGVFIYSGAGPNAAFSIGKTIGFDVVDLADTDSVTGPYNIDGIARLIQPFRVFRGSDREGLIFNSDAEGFDRNHPITVLREGLPKRFSTIHEEPDGSFRVRFDKFPQDDTRIEIHYVEVPHDLKDNSASIPLIPRKHVGVLVDATAMYIMFDKIDARATRQAQLVKGKLETMKAQNRAGQSRMGKNFSTSIARRVRTFRFRRNLFDHSVPTS